VTSARLIVISGPAGSGKTTLAHELGRALGCPVLCRDEIKQGMALAAPGFTPSTGDALSTRTFAVFFEAVGLLVRSGVTVIAEAAFQDRMWRRGLEPLSAYAELRIIRCRVDAATARHRVHRRLAEDGHRAVHDDAGLLRALDDGSVSYDAFVPISLPAPAVTVDTSDGYVPDLAAIRAFLDS
jgi:predicted kinase